MDRGSVPIFPKWINPKKNSIELYLHSYCKHVKTSSAEFWKEKRMRSLLKIKITMTTLYTIFFKLFKWKRDSKTNYFVLFVENKTYKKQPENEYLKFHETNQAINISSPF